MSAITPVTSMPADSASPSGMLTTALPQVRLQASTTSGGSRLTLLQKNEGGVWFLVPAERVLSGKKIGEPKATLDLVSGTAGEIVISNDFGSNAYHVLEENGGYAGNENGTATAYIAGAAAPVTTGDLSSVNMVASGTLSVGGASTLTGAVTAAAVINATGGEKLSGSSPAAAADAVGLGVADINGATTAALVRTYEGGGVSQDRVMSTSATVKRMTWAQSVADDATITIPLPTSLGMVSVRTYDEGGTASVKTDGTIAAVVGSTNFVGTDTDAKLCVFNNTTDVTVRNRLGASRFVIVEYIAA